MIKKSGRDDGVVIKPLGFSLDGAVCSLTYHSVTRSCNEAKQNFRPFVLHPSKFSETGVQSFSLTKARAQVPASFVLGI